MESELNEMLDKLNAELKITDNTIKSMEGNPFNAIFEIDKRQILRLIDLIKIISNK